MCGIIGMVSTRDVGPSLIEGLKNLEYRGYDSAGFTVWRDGRFITHKDVGRVANIEPFIPETNGAHIGMAPHRWATHGAPSATMRIPISATTAASPSSTTASSKIMPSCVNTLSTRRHFQSETDTEVIVQLIAHEAASRPAATAAAGGARRHAAWTAPSACWSWTSTTPTA
jgi:glucosamine--fructose-6-phosphate aminotransferase (isomerizing)